MELGRKVRSSMVMGGKVGRSLLLFDFKFISFLQVWQFKYFEALSLCSCYVTF